MKFSGLAFMLMSLLLYFHPAGAQFYSTGEAPAGIRWMKISTTRFSVIYPQGLKGDAARLISELERTATLTSQPYTRPAKQVPILLHSTSVLSNGYVTWTPRRMELVTTPPQDSYAQDWIGQLALHEYRHVVQISQLCQGFTSALSLLTGEIAPGSVSALLPSWLFEGDAVVNETLKSAAGRGRIPAFEMPLRTMLLENRKPFTYSKAIFGSYRDFVPSQYQYGYPMVSYGMARYGQTIWPGALNYTARNPYLIMPLVFYLNLNYHISRAGLYTQSLDSIKVIYNKQEDSITYIKYSSKNQRTSDLYTSYRLPFERVNGILALKTGIDQRDYFVEIDSSGHEKKVVTPGTVLQLKADVRGNYLVWDEIAADPRWRRRDFSELRLYDLNLHTLHNLTKRTRYFSPDFSPSGKTIAVAETDLQDNNFLTLLSTETGLCIRKIPSPGNNAIQFPEWLSETRIAVITVSSQGKQIEQVDLNTGQWAVILPFTRFDISELVHYRSYILFRSSYNAVENIFALEMKSHKIYQVTFSRFGAFNPSVSSDSTFLLFTDYTAQGYNVSSTSLDTSFWKESHLPANPSGIWPGTHTGDTLVNSPDESVPGISMDTAAYHKGTHLFHFHSWLPLYASMPEFTGEVNNLPVNLGFMLFSQNLLSTFTSSIGYYYSKGYHYFAPRFTWRGWYPVFELSGELGGPNRSLPLPEGDTLPDNGSPYYEYRIRTYVPLIFNRGRIISYLTPQVEYEHMAAYYFSGDQIRQGLDYIHFRLFMSRFLRSSFRDLYSRWGQYLSITYTITPGDPGQLGSLFSISGGLYLPGIANHHHLLLKGGYQKQYPEIFYLPINRISFPRGYPDAVSGEISSFSADYAFPVAYPDLSLGPVLYLKRLRADLFHDWSYGKNISEGNGRRFTGSYRSTGVEILADFHIGRIIFPISAGLRAGYLHDRNRYFTGFLVNIHTSAI